MGDGGVPTAAEVHEATEACRDHSKGLGSQTACVSLGKWFIEGTAVKGGDPIPQDPTRAARVFSHACQHGYGEACTYLGGLYMNGVGVPEDRQRAGALLYKGCELQHGYSCKVLGDFFTTGALSHPVLPKDMALAFKAFHIGCFEGAPANAEACSQVAQMFDGSGESLKAVSAWSKACQLGDEESCVKMEAAKSAQAAALVNK